VDVEAHARYLVASGAMMLVAVAALTVFPQAPTRRILPLPTDWRWVFWILLATQAGHVVEHAAQMVELHVLDLPPAGAKGLLGFVDIEWVHFLWSTYILVMSAILLRRFHWNRWLLLAVILGSWHELEHAVLLATYLATGVAGTPGILARGGVVGLAISRPDLHFLYNAMLTVLLLLAYRAETRRPMARLSWSVAA
jgi:hypothetical protein